MDEQPAAASVDVPVDVSVDVSVDVPIDVAVEAADLVAALRVGGLTLGCAESLTGGLVAATVTGVAGASAVLRGAVVAYAIDVKATVLGVPGSVLDELGAVSAETALAMADGARRVLGADLGVATTGVAGPAPSEGKPVGTVHVAVTGRRADGEQVRVASALRLQGSRDQIRRQTVAAAIGLLGEVLQISVDPQERG